MVSQAVRTHMPLKFPRQARVTSAIFSTLLHPKTPNRSQTAVRQSLGLNRQTSDEGTVGTMGTIGCGRGRTEKYCSTLLERVGGLESGSAFCPHAAEVRNVAIEINTVLYIIILKGSLSLLNES